MDQAQWQRVKEITADAFEREPSSRSAFVDEVCGGDAEVRTEVLRLLGQNTEDDFLSTPPLDLHSFLNRQHTRTPCFEPGQQVAGRFRIDRFLGLGGMGEVYAAFDLELHEPVALKTIRPAIASSADVIERFKYEVKETRRITHPCVCRVYDLFSEDRGFREPLWFLTMELLDGQTLHEALASRGPLPFKQALPLIRDMVAALSAAHTIGIVHRDFKPGNVMLLKDGTAGERAVVMDFGLALDLSHEQASRAGTAGDGTPAYMSPEQAVGSSIGYEADQYGLGFVICEMLTGSRPALDQTSAERSRRQLDQWLKAQSRRKLSVHARHVVRRCLEFEPERRFRQVSEIVPAITGSRQQSRLRWSAAAVAILCGIGIVLAVSAAAQGPKVTDAVRITPESGLSSVPGISRDGKWIVYSSDRAQPGKNLDIWIQPASTGVPRRLTTHPAVDLDPVISPDGKLVAFRSERDGGGLYLVGSDGSGERLLAAGGWSPTFSPDGRWIAYWLGTRDDAAPSGQLFVVSPDGRSSHRLAADFADARYPTWDPTGQFILFDGCKVNTTSLSTCTDWWVMRADGTDARNTGALALIKSQKIELMTPPQKAWQDDRIVFAGQRGMVVPLWALSLSPHTMRPAGVPRSITPGDAGDREPSLAETGAIVFGRITGALHIWRIPLKPSTTPATQETDDPGLDGCPSVSRDGRWLYFTRKIRGVRQLFVRDLRAGQESEVFTSEENKFWPVASPDGGRAAFEVRRETDSSIWLVERGGKPHILCSGCSHPTSWFAGDKAVIYTTAAGEIALLDAVTGASRIVLSPESGLVLGGADWNPDNRHLLFTAGRRGAAKQVFAVRFAANAAAPSGPWVQLTSEVAEVDLPHWSSDGKAFYFLSKRDASNCVWGRSFSALHGSFGPPFPVTHYHNLRVSPDRAGPPTRGLTVAEDAIYLNIGEVSTTLWLGHLTEPPLASLFRKFPRL